MKTLIRHIIFLLVCHNLFGQSNDTSFSVQGFIYGGKDEDALIGARVELLGENLSKTTDIHGFFKFNGLSKEKHRLKVSYIGFKSVVREIDLTSSGKMALMYLSLNPLWNYRRPPTRYSPMCEYKQTPSYWQTITPDDGVYTKYYRFSFRAPAEFNGGLISGDSFAGIYKSKKIKLLFDSILGASDPDSSDRVGTIIDGQSATITMWKENRQGYLEEYPFMAMLNFEEGLGVKIQYLDDSDKENVLLILNSVRWSKK